MTRQTRLRRPLPPRPPSIWRMDWAASSPLRSRVAPGMRRAAPNVLFYALGTRADVVTAASSRTPGAPPSS